MWKNLTPNTAKEEVEKINKELVSLPEYDDQRRFELRRRRAIMANYYNSFLTANEQLNKDENPWNNAR